MSKQFWGIIIVIVLVFVGVIAITNKKSDAPNGKNSNSSQITDHTKGAGTAGVTLVEYGDFQCPYCGLYYPTLQQVEQTYGDKLKFQFINFPLTSLHKNAFAAARAAEAAGLQDKYWEMYDMLYQNQNAWSDSSNPITIFDSYAKSIGLDVNQFNTDYASSKVNNLINADMAKGNKQDITATPTFFLNGKKLEVTNNAQDFEKQIDAAIAAQAAKDNKQ